MDPTFAEKGVCGRISPSQHYSERYLPKPSFGSATDHVSHYEWETIDSQSPLCDVTDVVWRFKRLYFTNSEMLSR